MSQPEATTPENKPKKKNTLIKFIIFIFLLQGAYAFFQDTLNNAAKERVAAGRGTAIEMVKASSSQAAKASYKKVPVANGVAVVSKDGLAYYWVRNGVVYAANGVAKTWDDRLKYSPPSIGTSLIDDAFEGKAPATVAVIPFTPDELIYRMNYGLKNYKLPTLKKSSYEWYEINPDSEYHGAFTFKEMGGEIAKARFEMNITGKKLINDYMTAFMYTFFTDETQEQIDKAFAVVGESFKHRNKEFSVTVKDKKYTAICKKGYVNIYVTPIAG